MNKLVRQVSFGLSMGFAAKIGVLGASWQDIAALGIVSMVALVLQGLSDQYEREILAKDIEDLKERIKEAEDKADKNRSDLSALKVNSGITTRRL